jgi:hypothetical protein
VSSVFSFLKPFLFMRYVLHIFQSLSFIQSRRQPSTCELCFLSP